MTLQHTGKVHFDFSFYSFTGIKAREKNLYEQ